MGVYTFILFMTVLISFLSTSHWTSKPVRLGDIVVYKKMPPNVVIYLISFVFIFFFSARWFVGTDFVNYYNTFHKLIFLDYDIIIKEYRDLGFYVLSSAIGKEISDNFFIYNAILGSIIYIPIVKIYGKYSKNFTLSLALYIMTCIYMWPFNGLRQAIATSIIFMSIPFLWNGKIIKFLAMSLIAFLFHSSVIIMMPFFFLIQEKAWSKKIVCIFIATVVMVFILPGIWSSVIGFLDAIGQTKMSNDYSDISSMRSGVNFFRLAVAFLPVFLSFAYYRSLRGNPFIDFFINLCLLNLLFMICGYRLTVLARFCSYFNLGLPLLIPEFLSIFPKSSRGIATSIIFLLFFLHMIVLLPYESDLIPYRFIFGNM